MADKFTGSKDVLADKDKPEEVPWGEGNPPPHGVNLSASDPDHDPRQPVLNPNTEPQPRVDGEDTA